MNIKKLMSGANPQSVMLEQTRGLKGKWERTGLLEGVGSETTKHGMAVMLENQAKQLLVFVVFYKGKILIKIKKF